MVGATGSKINWQNKFIRNIINFASQSPVITAEHIALQLPAYIERLYGVKKNDKEFYIAVFIAGVTTNGEKGMYCVADGQVMEWPHDNSHPWLTVGSHNEIPEAYISSRYKGTLLSKTKTIALLKETIATCSKQFSEEIGGSTFVYEISPSGIKKLSDKSDQLTDAG